MTYEGTSLEALAQQSVDSLLRKTELAVIAAYEEGLEVILSRLGTLYEKYGTSGALTYAEMSKYNRLNSMYSFLSDEIYDMTGKAGKDILRLSADAYEESYYRYGYALEQVGNLDIGFGLLNRDTIKAAVSFPQYGLPTSEILTRNSYALFMKARQEITRGLVLGESYAQMAKRIRDAIETDMRHALMIARTEATKSQTQGQLAAYDYAESKGVDVTTIWISTIDGRTRPEHVDLDGTSPAPDGLFHVAGDEGEGPGLFGTPGMNINCRCRLVAKVEGAPDLVRNTDKWDGTYEEWKKSLGTKKK